MPHLLAADIGGTKSDLAIFDLTGKLTDSPCQQKNYHNRDFSDFNAILTDFLGNSWKPDCGCIGVAAVISNGEARLTNRNWTLNSTQLQTTFNIPQISLINDLTAVCSALPLLQQNDLLAIQKGHPEKDGVLAVIAPGTGLGEGYCIDHSSFFFPQGSEGGHCDFAPLNREQAEMLFFLQKKYGAVSYELLCSGKGIPNIFDFFAASGHSRNDEQYRRVTEADDRTPPIIAGATAEPPCPLCAKTITVFMEILGAEAGNLALKSYATGGLFIGGGILPRITDTISFAPFLEAFVKKEKMRKLMERIPVHLITRKHVALLGTASYGWNQFHTDKA